MTDLQNYPSKKVILYFSLLGGAIGGLLLCIVIGCYLGLDKFIRNNSDINFTFTNIIYGSLTLLMISCLFGLIPSLVTGWYLAKTRTTQSLIKPFLVGSIVSFILLFPLCVIGWWLSNKYTVFIADTILAIIGGFSSVIVGKQVLPKGER